MSISVVIAVISILIFSFGLVSNIIKRYFLITDIQWYFCVGTLLRYTIWDPFFGFDKEQISFIVLEITRYIISIQLMATALRLPPSFFKNHYPVILYLVFVVLPLSILLSLCYGVLIFSHVNILTLLAVSVCLGPTDPVIISSIVQGSFAKKMIPNNLKHVMLAESGINDGGGYPFVYISIYLLKGSSFSEWTYKILLYENLLAILCGLLCGYIFGHLIDIAHHKKLADKDAYIVSIIPVTIFIVSSVTSYGGNGIIAVFVAGLVIDSLDTEPERKVEQRTIYTIDYLLSIVFSLLFAFVIPWASFDLYKIWRLLLFSLLTLFTRRVFFIMPFLTCDIFKVFMKKERLVNGLGLSLLSPVAVAGLFYASEIFLHTGNIVPFHVVSFVSICSIILHGSTSIIFGYAINI